MVLWWGAKLAIRIPLPDLVRKQVGNVHPYPFQIGIQALELMQGSLFYASFADVASGAYVRLPDGMENLERYFTERLDSKKTYDEAWGILRKYQVFFEKAAQQSVLIAMNSHWDWYARRLIDFIVFARQKLNSPVLERSHQKQLERFSSLPIGEQLEVIKVAAGVSFTVSEAEKAEFQEMALVRNLGLHNRWEIDVRYLERTKRSGYQLGEVRTFEIEELNRWHQLFHEIVRETSREVAKSFSDAPDYS